MVGVAWSLATENLGQASHKSSSCRLTRSIVRGSCPSCPSKFRCCLADFKLRLSGLGKTSRIALLPYYSGFTRKNCNSKLVRAYHSSFSPDSIDFALIRLAWIRCLRIHTNQRRKSYSRLTICYWRSIARGWVLTHSCKYSSLILWEEYYAVMHNCGYSDFERTHLIKTTTDLARVEGLAL